MFKFNDKPQATLDDKINHLTIRLPSGLTVPELLQKKYDCNETDWKTFLESLTENDCKKALKDLENIIEQRKQNQWKISGIKDAPTLEFIKREISLIERTKMNPNNFLGRGASGIVFMSDNKKTVCIKWLHDKNKTKHNIHSECELQERAFDSLDLKNKETSEKSPLKIPPTLNVIENTDPLKDFFTMDTVEGLNIEEIQESKERFSNLFNNNKEILENLLKKFESSNFICSLQECLKKIHRAGIIHADLHTRNLMLDKKGDIYIIDFGNSIDLLKTEAPYETIENLKERDLIALELMVKILIKTLKSLTSTQ